MLDRADEDLVALANVRAAAGALPRELAYLAGREPRPRVQLGEAQMSRALGSGLDVWWLALTRLGLVPRLAALGIGMALLLAAVLAMRRSLLTASRATRIAPPA